MWNFDFIVWFQRPSIRLIDGYSIPKSYWCTKVTLAANEIPVFMKIFIKRYPNVIIKDITTVFRCRYPVFLVFDFSLLSCRIASVLREPLKVRYWKFSESNWKSLEIWFPYVLLLTKYFAWKSDTFSCYEFVFASCNSLTFIFSVILLKL